MGTKEELKEEVALLWREFDQLANKCLDSRTDLATRKLELEEFQGRHTCRSNCPVCKTLAETRESMKSYRHGTLAQLELLRDFLFVEASAAQYQLNKLNGKTS